jgi:hypothetical protein
MLDYSSWLGKLGGAAVFRRAAARYVPKRAGVYQIVPLPFSFGAMANDAIVANYIKAIRRQVLDFRRPVIATCDNDEGQLITRIRGLEVALPAVPSEQQGIVLRQAAPLFPPFYVGCAISLRDRFIEHVTGSNSQVLERLDGLQLKDAVCFFRWHLADLSAIDFLETLLIQAHRPILNTQLS